MILFFHLFPNAKAVVEFLLELLVRIGFNGIQYHVLQEISINTAAVYFMFFFLIITAEQSENIKALSAQLTKKSEENAVLHDDISALLSEVSNQTFLLTIKTVMDR